MQVVLDDYVWTARVATDLVNTSAEVWGGDERLPDLAALRRFADEHPDPTYLELGDGRDTEGALARLAATAVPADLEAVRALRLLLRDLIDHPQQERLVRSASALTTANAGATLVGDPGANGHSSWALTPKRGASIADTLAIISGVGILGVVHSLGVERFRQCGAPTCLGAFIDTTRPGRRRYCMPGLCGNRVNVANHRARRATRATFT